MRLPLLYISEAPCVECSLTCALPLTKLQLVLCDVHLEFVHNMGRSFSYFHRIWASVLPIMGPGYHPSALCMLSFDGSVAMQTFTLLHHVCVRCCLGL